jgi:hypothetical protein
MTHIQGPGAMPAGDWDEVDPDRAEAYRDLDKLSAMVRITATTDVKDEAEKLLLIIRETQVFAAHPTGRAGWDGLELRFAQARSDFVTAIRGRRKGQAPEIP